MHTHHSHLLILCVVALSLSSACKTTATKQPSSPSTPPPASSPSKAPAVTTTPSFDLSPEATRAILSGLGCPDASITSTGCKVCPVYDSAPRDEELLVDLDGGEIGVTLTPGVFTEEQGAQVIASFDGCQQAVAGVYRVTEMVHMVQENDGVWAPRSATILEDLRECRQIAWSGERHITLCDMFQGRMGLYVELYDAIHWNLLEPTGEGLSAPWRQTLLSGVYASSCAENFELYYKVDMKPVDLDSDGVTDLEFEVVSREGGYEGPLDECLDGEYEAPLTPEREEKKRTQKLVYMATPTGYREASGASGEVRYSAEFDDIY